MRRAIVVLSVALAAAACGTMPGTPGLPGSSVEMEMRGFPTAFLAWDHTGYATRRRIVVRDEEAWREVWEALHPNQTSRPARPTVDFADEMVIVVAQGTQPTTGHAIHIDGVREANGDIWVFVREVTPALSCDRTPIAHSPAAAVRVDRRDGGATFVERGETTVCD